MQWSNFSFLFLTYICLSTSARLFQRVYSHSIRHPQMESVIKEKDAVRSMGISILAAHFHDYFAVEDMMVNSTFSGRNLIENTVNTDYYDIVISGGDAAEIIFYDENAPKGDNSLTHAYDILSDYKNKLLVLVHIYLAQGTLSGDFINLYINFEDMKGEE